MVRVAHKNFNQVFTMHTWQTYTDIRQITYSVHCALHSAQLYRKPYFLFENHFPRSDGLETDKFLENIFDDFNMLPDRDTFPDLFGFAEQ